MVLLAQCRYFINYHHLIWTNIYYIALYFTIWIAQHLYFYLSCPQSDSVTIHQRLILEEKGAAKEKKKKKKRGGRSKQEGAGAWNFSPLYLWICGYNRPLIWLSGGLLFTFRSPAHSSPPGIQEPSLHRATRAELLSPACPPSWIPDASLLRHLEGHMSMMFTHSVHPSCLLGWPKSPFGFFHNILQKNPSEQFGPPNICITSEINTGSDAVGVKNIYRREKGREEEREEGREEVRRERKEYNSFLLFQAMLKLISTSKCWAYWSTFLRYWTEFLLTEVTSN